jgi:hypothetical protein
MFHGKNNIPNPVDTSKILRICADLEKNGGQNCSTGQRFICTEVTSYKIHILGILLVSTGFGILFFCP